MKTPIIPISIKGGFKIFPRHHRFPSMFDWKHYKRHEIFIEFGKAIEPCVKKDEVPDVTNRLKNEIVRMCNEDWN